MSDHFPLVHKNLNVADKQVYIVNEYNKDKDKQEIVRTIILPFIDEADFEIKSLNACYTEWAKIVLSGLDFHAKTFCYAKDFSKCGKGHAVEKRLYQQLKHYIRFQKLRMYPTTTLDNEEFFKFSTNVAASDVIWDETCNSYEGDLTTLTYTINATRRIKDVHKIYLNFQNHDPAPLEAMLKYWSFQMISEPTDDCIVVTDQYITPEVAKFLSAKQPVAIIGFNDSDYDHFSSSEDAYVIMKENDVHYVPASITKLGSTLIAEGLANHKRSVGDTYELLKMYPEKVENLWKFADNYRVNFNDICLSIADAILLGTQNPYKLNLKGYSGMELKV